MRKIMLILWACVFAFETFAQSQVNDALYIYRNDGKFNAFFYSEIDSITTSKSDELGNVYDEYKSQVVWTQDSVYWIPLEAIDSVSLCKPQNKYSSRVRKIDELLPYITEVNGLGFNLSSTTPANLMPKWGEVLLYESFDDERFPFGFAGRVNEVENLIITCDSVSFEDVYDNYVCFGEYAAIEEQDSIGNSRLRLAPQKVEGKISPSISIKETIGSSSSGLSATLDGRLAFDLRIICKIEPSKPAYFDLSLSPNIKATVGVGVKGKFNPMDFLSKKVTLAGIPIPNTLFFLKVKGGPVIKPSVEASLTASTEAEIGFKAGIKYEQGTFNKYCYNTSKRFAPPTISGSISGRIFAGIQLEFGVFSVGEILSASIEKELGPEIVANLTENILSSNKYEEFQKAKIDLNFLASIGAKAGLKFSALKINGNLTGRFTLASISTNIFSWKLVPSFSSPVIDLVKLTKATISVVPDDKLLPPGVEIGLGVWDKDSELVDAQYCPERYRVLNEWPLEKYQTTFEGLIPGSQYEVYPMVKLWGVEMKASPSTTLVMASPLPAKITNFEVNSASFVRDGFEYKDKTYFYDYAATTTVELENAEGVEDWGYVYKDPDGDTIHISVKDLGTNADSRYDYYRTIPKSTATLYGYAKYAEDKYAYEEPKEYPLEYTFHPKAYVGEVIADSITTTSAQFEYGFDDVPRTGKCYVACQAVDEDEPKIEQVAYTEKDTIKVANLHPATTYNYWAYVEYAGETYMDLNGKKSFTTLTPSAYVEKADEEKITTTSAQVVYGFKNVPENAKCFIAIRSKIDDTSETGEEIHSSYSQNYSVSNTEKGIYELTGLNPSTTYTYFAYIEYEEDLWSSDKESFTTRTPPPPVATTGDCSNVTTTSATVSCTFENVPDDGVCGVVYKWGDGEFSKKTANNVNGTQTITLSGLSPGTTYTYNAFIEANGQTYYGEEKTFSTKYEIPDITGVWHCKEYQEGNLTGEVTFELQTDGTVIESDLSGSGGYGRNRPGQWSINNEGHVNIQFSWQGFSGGDWKSYGGTINSFINPSQIEGTANYTYVGNMGGGSQRFYDFLMTR